MHYENDPYFKGKLNEIQANFLDYSPSISSQNPGVFFFSGNSYSIKKRSEEISCDQFSQYKGVRINITGTKTKQSDYCCFWTTIIIGSIIIFPLFFLCCDWWKKKVNRLYNIENSGYDAVINLIRLGNVEELYLMVQDNFFNRKKGEALIEALQESRVKNFVFTNVSGGFDSDGSNYSDFTSYMRPIKSIIRNSDVSWGPKVVL